MLGLIWHKQIKNFKCLSAEYKHIWEPFLRNKSIFLVFSKLEAVKNNFFLILVSNDPQKNRLFQILFLWTL